MTARTLVRQARRVGSGFLHSARNSLDAVERFVTSNWRLIGAHTLLLILLTTLALRDYILNPGFLIYRDWVWPVSLTDFNSAFAVFSPNLWTNVGPDAAGFTRSMLTWPVMMFAYFGASSQELEEAFLLYIFTIGYILAYLAGRFAVSWVRPDFSGLRRECFITVFIVLAFVNPAALQWEAGVYFTFLWGVPLLVIAFSAILISVRSNHWRYSVISGIALGIGAILDPRIFIWGTSAICFLVLGGLFYLRPRLRLLRNLGVVLASSLPSVLLTLYAYSWGGYLGGQAFRGNSLASLNYFSSNAGPFFSVILTNYWWTVITYTPPYLSSAIRIGGVLTLGSPPVYAVTPGAFFTIWFLALCAFPALAFGSLLTRRVHGRVMPFAVVAVITILFSMGAASPTLGALPTIEIWLGKLPAIGGIMQTVFAGPYYISMVTEAAYLVLAVMGCTLIYDYFAVERIEASVERLQSVSRPAFHFGLSRRIGSRGTVGAIAVLLTVGVVCFGSWQVVSGDFGPAGFTPGVSNNGIPSVGALSPEKLPSGDVLAYDSLATNSSPSNVYWPGASLGSPPYYPGVAGLYYTWTARSSPSLALDSPRPFAEPVGIQDLIESNLTADTAPLLRSFGIGSVVVEDLSPGALIGQYGTSNFSRVLSFFNNSPGLVLSDLYGNSTWVYSVNGSPEAAYFTNLPVYYAASPQVLGPALGGLESLGLVPLFSSSPSSTASPLTYDQGISVNPGDVSILSGPAIEGAFLLNTTQWFSSAVGVPQNMTVPGGVTQYFSSPYSDWGVSTWDGPGSGSLNASVSDEGYVEISRADSPALFSIDYPTPLISGQSNGIVTDPTSLVTVSVSMQYRGSVPSGDGVYFDVVGSNVSLINNIESESAPGFPTASWQNLTFTTQMPIGTAQFAVRVMTTMTGYIQIRNVTIGWGESAAAPTTFAGHSAEVENGSFNISTVDSATSAVAHFLVRGIGTISSSGQGNESTLPFSTDTYEWVALPYATGTTALEFSCTCEIAGLISVPGNPVSLVEDRLGPQASFDGTAYTFQVTLSTPETLVLVRPFTTHWQATVDGRSLGAHLGGKPLNYTVFELPAGNYTLRITLADQEFGVPLLVLCVALNLGLFAVAVQRWRSLTSSDG